MKKRKIEASDDGFDVIHAYKTKDKLTEIARLNSLNENQIAEIYALSDKNNRNSNQIDALTTHEADLETERKRLSMQ